MKNILLILFIFSVSSIVISKTTTFDSEYSNNDLILHLNSIKKDGTCMDLFKNKATKKEDVDHIREMFISAGKLLKKEEIMKELLSGRCPQKDIILVVKMKHDGKTFVSSSKIASNIIHYYYKNHRITNIEKLKNEIIEKHKTKENYAYTITIYDGKKNILSVIEPNKNIDIESIKYKPLMNSDVKIKFPGKPKYTNLGTHVYEYKSKYGIMKFIIAKIGVEIDSESMLLLIYQTLLNTMINASGGIEIESNIFKIRDIIGKFASYKTQEENATILNEIKIIILNNKTYMILYSYSEDKKDLVQQEKGEFFDSIEIDNKFNFKNQLNPDKK